MDLLAEGVESLKLACSLVLLIPAIGVALMGRWRATLTTAWVLTVAFVAWVRFAGWWTAIPSGGGHIAAGLVVVGLAAVTWKLDELVPALAATVAAACVATWTWVPCVGAELGEVLNGARAEPWAQAFPTLIYFLGLFAPLIVFAALDVAIPQLREILQRDALRTVGVTIVLGVGVLVAVTLFDDLAGELAKRSSF